MRLRTRPHLCLIFPSITIGTVMHVTWGSCWGAGRSINQYISKPLKTKEMI